MQKGSESLYVITHLQNDEHCVKIQTVSGKHFERNKHFAIFYKISTFKKNMWIITTLQIILDILNVLMVTSQNPSQFFLYQKTESGKHVHNALIEKPRTVIVADFI